MNITSTTHDLVRRRASALALPLGGACTRPASGFAAHRQPGAQELAVPPAIAGAGRSPGVQRRAAGREVRRSSPTAARAARPNWRGACASASCMARCCRWWACARSSLQHQRAAKPAAAVSQLGRSGLRAREDAPGDGEEVPRPGLRRDRLGRCRLGALLLERRRPAPDDYKGMKFFAWGSEPEQQAIMKSLGYTPVPLETGDILPSIQTGMINVVPSTPYFALASADLQHRAPNMLEINWAPDRRCAGGDEEGLGRDVAGRAAGASRVSGDKAGVEMRGTGTPGSRSKPSTQ